MTIRKRVSKIYKAEPVVTLAAGQVAGNGALHPILEAASLSPTAHTLIHGGVTTCLFLAARQSVFSPKTVEEMQAETPPKAGV